MLIYQVLCSWSLELLEHSFGGSSPSCVYMYMYMRASLFPSFPGCRLGCCHGGARFGHCRSVKNKNSGLPSSAETLSLEGEVRVRASAASDLCSQREDMYMCWVGTPILPWDAAGRA